MADSFQVNPEFASSLENLLMSAASAQGNHKAALAQIGNLKGNSDFYSYCAAIMNKYSGDQFKEKQHVRYLATLQIKNGMMNQNCAQNLVVRDFTLRTLQDPEDMVQRLVASIVAEAVSRNAWPPEAVGLLLDNLQNALQNNGVPGGYVHALWEIIDRHVQLVDMQFSPRVLQLFVPMLEAATSLNLPQKIVEKLLESVVIIAEQAGVEPNGRAFAELNNNHDLFQKLLSYLGGAVQGQDAHAVQHGIRCLYMLFTFEDKMVNYFEPMANMMLEQLANIPVERVKLEVVEFWRAVLRRPSFVEKALNVMPNVLRLILSFIVYEQAELQQLRQQENNWKVADRPEDVRPKQFQIDRAKKNIHRDENGDDEGNDNNNNNNNNNDNDDDDDENDDDDDDEVQEWNLRQAAIQCLDELGQLFGEKIVGMTMEVVKAKMGSNDWRDVDSAVTALGAVSAGCIDFMGEPLQFVVPRLCDMVRDQQGCHFLVRCSCLWTLGRYAEWIVANAPDGSFLEKTLNCICEQMLNTPSKKVQAAAVVALQDIAEQCPDHELDNFAKPIVSTVSQCFSRFQLKNRYLLFETVDVLCSVLDKTLADQETFDMLTQPLSLMWAETPDDSPLIYPLFACMSGICSAVGGMIQPLAGQLFERCIKIGEIICPMRASALAAVNGDIDLADLPPDTEEFLVAAIDLLSGLFEALGTSMEPLVSSVGSDRVMQIFLYCADEVSSQVRTSAFGALGELARSCTGMLQPSLPRLFPIMVKHLTNPAINGARNNSNNDDGVVALHASTASNVAWTLTNLLQNQSEAAGPMLQPDRFPDLFRNLAYSVANPPADSRNMQENFCVLMGFMADDFPGLLQQLEQQYRIQLSSFLKPWCDLMRGTAPTPQTVRAVNGMLTNCMMQRPQEAAMCLYSVLDVFMQLPGDTSLEMRNTVTQFLNNLKQGMGAQWAQRVGQYKRKRQLYERFGVQ